MINSIECCRHVQQHEINSYGSLSKKPDIITNTFNEYFAKVGPNLAKKIKKVDGNRTMYINQVVDYVPVTY